MWHRTSCVHSVQAAAAEQECALLQQEVAAAQQEAGDLRVELRRATSRQASSDGGAGARAATHSHQELVLHLQASRQAEAALQVGLAKCSCRQICTLQWVAVGCPGSLCRCACL